MTETQDKSCECLIWDTQRGITGLTFSTPKKSLRRPPSPAESPVINSPRSSIGEKEVYSDLDYHPSNMSIQEAKEETLTVVEYV